MLLSDIITASGPVPVQDIQRYKPGRPDTQCNPVHWFKARYNDVILL
jgi:hypothetical protein